MSENTFLNFGHNRIRPITDCNNVKKLFGHARAAKLITKQSDDDILVVKFVNDEATSDVEIMREDVKDFRELTDSVSRSNVWGSGLLTGETGQKLFLDVTLMD